MHKSNLLALAIVACNSGSATPPPVTSDVPTILAPHPVISPSVAPPATEGPVLDKSAVLEKLTGSRAAISRLKSDCQLLYSDPPAENLGSIVNSQYREAKTWEAKCQPSRDRHSECTVTLANDQSEDEEFMARYSFELDANRILIESSVGCVFAG